MIYLLFRIADTADIMDCAVFTMSNMSHVLGFTQTHTSCRICLQHYPNKWCKDTLCLYCANFLPMRDTRYSIIKDIEWYFIKSGENDRHTFYNEYIDNLNLWCAHFKIGYKREDRSIEYEMRNIYTA